MEKSSEQVTLGPKRSQSVLTEDQASSHKPCRAMQEGSVFLQHIGESVPKSMTASSLSAFDFID